MTAATALRRRLARLLPAWIKRRSGKPDTPSFKKPKCWTPFPKGQGTNPFEGQSYYVNPSYRDLLQSSIKTMEKTDKRRTTMEKMQNIPSAFWIDVKSKIKKGCEISKEGGCEKTYAKGKGHPDLSTVEGILEDAAKCDPPHLVVFMVYDLPNRDCWALASNGEICCHYGKDVGRTKCEMGPNGFYKEYVGEGCKDGLLEYRQTYVAPFAEVVKKFDGRVPVVLVIEPDSLPNMITNMKDKRPDPMSLEGFRGCTDESKAAYMDGTKYSVEKFSETDAKVYIDAGHGGWLGWANPEDDAPLRYAALMAELKVDGKIRGFATNVANYQPIGEIKCPAPGTCRGWQGNGEACCKDDPCGLRSNWNWAHNELNYVDLLDARMKAAGAGSNFHYIIDTGRNGNAMAATRDCSNWCNPRTQGIGHVPTTKTADPRIDAYYWLKTPGESDGCTEQLPEGGKCPRFDKMCASKDSIGSKAGEPRAPEAGDRKSVV